MPVYRTVTALLLEVDTDKKEITVRERDAPPMEQKYTYNFELEEDFIANNLGKYVEIVLRDNEAIDIRELPP